MIPILSKKDGLRLILEAETAASLMKENPISVSADETVQEAVAVLTERGFSAAPVIDEAGRPVGVLSRTDLLWHDRERVEYLPGEDSDSWEEVEEMPSAWAAREGFQEVRVDRTRVSEVMTPLVYTVTPTTPAEEVVRQMLARKIHRLFVSNDDGILIGVITASDILRHLLPEYPDPLFR
jgi:CBS domain-containing protein